MKKIMLLITFLMTIVLLFGCSSGSQSQTPQQAPQQQPSAEAAKTTVPQSSEQASVTIQNFKFTPQDITVKVGTKVTWTNQDGVPHTVESSDGTLRSDQLEKGDTHTYTFTKPGTYNYKCGIHPSMHGSVTVQ